MIEIITFIFLFGVLVGGLIGAVFGAFLYAKSLLVRG